MMLRLKRKKKTFEKLNLVPILDAVFIFIFFLLMSAQFLDVYEIETNIPSIKTIEQNNQDKEPPLNLILEINNNKMEIKTGLDEITYLTINQNVSNSTALEELSGALKKIKYKHPKENSIILRPDKTISYKRLIKIMDSVKKQTIKSDGEEINIALFEQIIYDN